MTSWYVIHTKPKQEQCALENLQRQNYECYLPTLSVEHLKNGVLSIRNEPLFARYLFIYLTDTQNWAPIRSTKGVSSIVSFGGSATKVADEIISLIRVAERQHTTQQMFSAGDVVRITSGPFCGIQGIYQMANKEDRAFVLIQLNTQPTQLSIDLNLLQKVS